MEITTKIKQINRVVVAALWLASILIPLRSVHANPSECKSTSSEDLRSCLKENSIVHDIQVVVNFLSAGWKA